jgi:hypothetical protein
LTAGGQAANDRNVENDTNDRKYRNDMKGENDANDGNRRRGRNGDDDMNQRWSSNRQGGPRPR